MATAEAEDPAARVGHPQGLERPLDAAILPAPAVQRDEYAVELARGEASEALGVGLQSLASIPCRVSACQHRPAAVEGDRPLRGAAAHQDRDLAEVIHPVTHALLI